MRKQTTILLILMTLSGLLVVLHFLPQSVPVSDPSNPPIAKPYIYSAPIPQETPFSRDILRSNPLPNLPAFSNRRESLSEKLANKTLPKLLSGKEGSYTDLTDLFAGDGSSSVDLRSDWATRYLLPNWTLPRLQMHIIKNPLTGEYQPAGGSITVPGFPFEAGYEALPGTEEHKATLQWKKSF